MYRNTTTKNLLRSIASAMVMAGAAAGHSNAQSSSFSFGVFAHADKTLQYASQLREVITETDNDNLAFVVANGIKTNAEPCTDELYERRKSMLEQAKNGVILSLAASDWSDCKNTKGRSSAINRLSLLRDMFFVDEFSFGASRIPVSRQSTMTQFRNYGENARWEIGDVIFATINIPANNNHYVTDAGRNNEFEDRLIANREWLERLHQSAKQKKMAGIVLFCDGNPLAKPQSSSFFSRKTKRDGYAETRRMISAMASKYPGKILIVHGQSGAQSMANGINWNKNLGHLDVSGSWVKLTVNAASPTLFSVHRDTLEAKSRVQ